MTFKEQNDMLNEMTRGLPPEYKKAFLDGFHNGDGTPMDRPPVVRFPRLRVSFVVLKTLWRKMTRWIRQ